MTPLRIFVVEDEIIIVRHMQRILRRLGYEPVGHACRGTEALQRIAGTLPDLVLVDIMLRGELDGVQVAQRVHTDFGIPVVFVTSLSDPATVARATAARPHGYLLKPFDERDVAVALQLALAPPPAGAAPQPSLPLQSPPVAPAASHPLANCLFVRTGKESTRIDYCNLLWLEASGKYTILHTRTSRHTLSVQLKQVAESLPAHAFVRIHKSYMVGLHAIEAVAPHHVRVAGQPIPLGRAYQESLLQQLTLLNPT
jgi:DNA-binding LytR/AlgR family response regulator